MAKGYESPLPQGLVRFAGVVENGDGTNKVEIHQAGAEGEYIETMGALNSSGSLVNVELWVDEDGTATNYHSLGVFPVPAYAGKDGLEPVVSVRNQLTQFASHPIKLMANEKLYAAVLVTVDGGEQVAFNGQGYGYDAS